MESIKIIKKNINIKFILFFLCASFLFGCGSGGGGTKEEAEKPKEIFIKQNENTEKVIKKIIEKGDIVVDSNFIEASFLDDELLIKSKEVESPTWAYIDIINKEKDKKQSIYIYIENASAKSLEKDIYMFFNNSGNIVDLKEIYNIYLMKSLISLENGSIDLKKYKKIKKYFSIDNLTAYYKIQEKINEFSKSYNEYKIGILSDNKLKKEYLDLIKTIELYAKENSRKMFTFLADSGVISYDEIIIVSEIYYKNGNFSYFKNNPRYGDIKNGKFEFYEKYGYMSWLE